jgi:predicted ferric reductase
MAPVGVAKAMSSIIFQNRLKGRRWREDILITFSWLLIAFPLAIYFANHAFGDFTSFGKLLTGVGIIAGLIGTSLILLMLLLAARIPYVEKTFGQDKLINLHGKIGKPAFYFITAHIIFLTFSYTVGTSSNFFTETFSLLASTGDMLEAYLSFGALIVVVVTSLLIVFHKLPYEAWHVIHLLSYASVLLALPHQLSMSSIFTAGAIQTVYWEVFYWGTLAAVLAFRFLLPIGRSYRNNMRVDSVKQLAPDVYAIDIRGRDLDSLKMTGGKYLHLRFLTAKTFYQSNPFSISRLPQAGTFRVTFKIAGKGTQKLAALKAGTRVAFEGPYGNFTYKAKNASHTLMIGSGIGITPILALAQDMPKFEQVKTLIVFRHGSDNDIYHFDEFTELATLKEIGLYKSLGSRHESLASWLGKSEAAAGISIRNYLPSVADTDVFLCGPNQWMDLVVKDALAQGVPVENIHYERFVR